MRPAIESSKLLIVGQGLAGTILARRLEEKGAEVTIIDNGHLSASSMAAAGLFNPIIIKRQKKVWRADEFLTSCTEFFRNESAQIDSQFFYHSGIKRRVDGVQELNDWHSRMGSAQFSDHLSESEEPSYTSIDTPNGSIDIRTAGWVDVREYLTARRTHWKNEGKLWTERFEDAHVQVEGEFIEYKNRPFDMIVLCRGYKENAHDRFFPDLPFNLAKGQSIVAKIEGLRLQGPIHVGPFLLPLGAGEFRLGSTYSWTNFNEEVEPEKTETLLKKLSAHIPAEHVQVREEWAGVRPTVKDRRPLLGLSKVDSRVGLFNGMGSRAVLMAPLLAEEFIDYLFGKSELPSETDCHRPA